MASAARLRLSEDFGIDGALGADGVASLAAEYKGVLYLCPDCDGDTGVADGGNFAALAAAFPAGCAVHVVVSPSDPCFQADTYREPTTLAMLEAVKKFAAVERALDALPRPTAIMCKSNRRAGMVWAAYTGVKGGKTAAEVRDVATAKSLPYLGTPGFAAWVDAVVTALRRPPAPLLFRQMFEAESSTYTYLLADAATKEAILIDPVLETVERDLEMVEGLGLNLTYMLNTHVHADHITGTGKIKQLLAAQGKKTCQSVIAAVSGAVADMQLPDGGKVVFGGRHVVGLNTPGHTAGCFSFVLDDYSAVFTGDALLIHGCGRTDFQGGSSEQLYRSVHDRILSLRSDTTVYPAHDYKGLSSSSVAEELAMNPRLTKTLPEFVEIMNNLQLPYPKKIDASLPANLKCGL